MVGCAHWRVSCLPHSDASNASAVCRSVIAVHIPLKPPARHFSSGRPSNSTCLRCAACFRLSQSVSSPSPPLPACQLMRPARSRFLPESHLRPNLFKMYPQWFFPAGRFLMHCGVTRSVSDRPVSCSTDSHGASYCGVTSFQMRCYAWRVTPSLTRSFLRGNSAELLNLFHG